MDGLSVAFLSWLLASTVLGASSGTAMTSRLRRKRLDALCTPRGPGTPLVGENERRHNAGLARHRKLRQIALPRADGAAASAEISPGPNRGAAARPNWQRYWYLPVFAVYLGIVGVTVAHHEPWLDEAQAWLIARDAAWSDLFCTIPRYEGSPGLWHLLLTLPARCGLPYASLNVIAAAFSAGGVLLLLACSPLPKLLTAMVPFTFFLVYQNAVVARSYALMPLLLFAAAAAYPNRLRRPFLYVVPLGFLAHVSAHGLLISAGLVGLLSIEVLYGWWRNRGRLPLRRAALAVGLFGLVALGAAWQVRPVADHLGGLGYEYPLWPRIQFAGERLSGAFTDAYVPSAAVLVASLAWFWYARALAVYAVPMAAVLAALRDRSLLLSSRTGALLDLALCPLDQFPECRRDGKPECTSGRRAATALDRPCGGRVRRSSLLGRGKHPQGSARELFGRQGPGRIPQTRRPRFQTDRV